MADPMRGEIWLADLSAGRGHEQAGQRPVLIVSDDGFNCGLAGLLMVVPLTSKTQNRKTSSPTSRSVHPKAGSRRQA
jgi:mRNA-degrading endonuclease toxin of MazEF toxin-antitoxin module